MGLLEKIGKTVVQELNYWRDVDNFLKSRLELDDTSSMTLKKCCGFVLRSMKHMVRGGLVGAGAGYALSKITGGEVRDYLAIGATVGAVLDLYQLVGRAVIYKITHPINNCDSGCVS